MNERPAKQPPWKRDRPDTPPTTLTAQERHEARERARAAGRRYPNLVDNMAIVRKRKNTPAKTSGTGGGKSTKE